MSSPTTLALLTFAQSVSRANVRGARHSECGERKGARGRKWGARRRSLEYGQKVRFEFCDKRRMPVHEIASAIADDFRLQVLERGQQLLRRLHNGVCGHLVPQSRVVWPDLGGFGDAEGAGLLQHVAHGNAVGGDDEAAHCAGFHDIMPEPL